MRLANQIRPLFVGLPIVLSQALVAALPAAAWSPFGSEPPQPPAISDGIVRGAGGTAVVPRNPRWTQSQAVQPAYAEDLSAAAGGVEQASHTGPSRGGTLFGASDRRLFGGTTAMPFGSSKSRTQATTQTGGKKGPTWRGYELRMPAKMFGRGTSSARQQQPDPVTSDPRVRAFVAGRAGSLPQPTGQNRTHNTTGGNMSANVTPSGGARSQTAVAPGRRVTEVPRVATSSRSFVPTQQMPAPDVRSHNIVAAPASFPRPSSATPIQPVQAASATPAAATPKTPADRLIFEAHDFAAEAKSEQDFTRIIETCRRARASQPSASLVDYANQLAAWSFNRRGQIRAETGRLKEAMLDFDDAIRANPQLWRALHNRGVLQAQAGNYERAFDDLNLTIQYNPEFAKAYSNRAALFVVAGDLPAALEDYGAAIELDPNLAVAHRGRGRVCHLLGRLDEALDHYDAAVQLAPKDAYATSSRADLLTDLGRYAEAATGYEQAIRTDARFASAYRGSAWLLATCPDSTVRNADLAVERAQMAIEMDGHQDAVGFDTLAAAQASAGDFSAAMHSLRQAIHLAPDNEREVYQDRLKLYQRAKPYRIAPLRDVEQASHDESY